jgi:hypothetical protein
MMFRPRTSRLLVLVCALATGAAAHADAGARRDIRDLFFGEALFHSYQQDYFGAIARLDAELAQYYALDDPNRDSLRFHREESELSVGDLELSWRMHRKVGRAMQRLLRDGINDSIRDRAAYRLARIAYKTGDFEGVPAVLDRMSKSAPPELRAQGALLRGQALIELGRFDEAIESIKPVRDHPAVAGFATFNLGVATMEKGEVLPAAVYFDQLGTSAAGRDDLLALRDKANLTLGAALLKEKQAERARPYFERVQISGPFSNKALLWVGWSDAALGRYDEALVPWMMLRKRDITDVAVQEALLAAPYGYTQLKAFGRAALLYGEAVETFDKEIKRLDDSIASIREGKFLAAMLSEQALQHEQWLLQLRQLPDAPETRYLRDLLSSHVFQQSYQNYRDLEAVRGNIDGWIDTLPALQDLVRLRAAYYAPLLRDIDAALNRLGARLGDIEARRATVANELNVLLRKRNPMALASVAEHRALQRLKDIDHRITRMAPQPGIPLLRRKQQRLQGAVLWRVHTEYENRLSLAHAHLKELDAALVTTRANQVALQRQRAEAALGYQGYDRALQDLHQRLQYLKTRIEGVMAHQGQYMERRAVTELQARKRRLGRYRTKARFALAESYDLAMRAAEEAKKKK